MDEVPFFSILCVTFTAVCVWLTVRIVNHWEHWAMLTLLNLIVVAVTLIALWWAFYFVFKDS